MKVLIHALGADMGGAVRHVSNLISELGKCDSETEYTVLVRKGLKLPSTAPNIKIERVSDAVSRNWLLRLVLDVFLLPRRLRRADFDVVVSLTNFGPIMSPIPHVIFQCNALYYCPYYLALVKGRRKLENLFRQRLALASLVNAALVVTPSNSMREMIQTASPSAVSRRFACLYHGFDAGTLSDPLDERFACQFANARGAKLLYPTHPSPHKGFEVLFDALALVKASGVETTLFTTIERSDWPEGIAEYERRIAELGIQDNVVFLGRIPQGQMGAVYKTCDLMVYPSLTEAFGFSMIEALGHGLPIVAAGTPINREICAGGALYYSPLDSKQAAECILKALDPDVQAGLRAGGRAGLQSFEWGWDRYAREFVSLLQSVK